MTMMTQIDTDGGLTAILAHQRAAFLRDGPPSLAERKRDLNKLKVAIIAREETFVAALDADFGHRSREETMLFDIGSTVSAINYLLSNVARWMCPEPRGAAMVFLPGSNRVIYQPLGVIGIMSPWNYPIGLALIPLATALAAGNRAMLKPSELAPATTGLIASMIAETFEQDQVAVVTGDAKVGAQFSSLPFDHLLFTGSTPVGKSIMRAAAEKAAAVESASKRIVFEVVLNENQGNFKFGKTQLPDEAKAAIDELITKIKSNPNGAFFEIEGHTDNAGDPTTNERIGMERAETVKRYLYEQHQIPLHRMNVISYGEDKPAADNKTRDGRAQNRRVVIKVLA